MYIVFIESLPLKRLISDLRFRDFRDKRTGYDVRICLRNQAYHIGLILRIALDFVPPLFTLFALETTG